MRRNRANVLKKYNSLVTLATRLGYNEPTESNNYAITNSGWLAAYHCGK